MLLGGVALAGCASPRPITGSPEPDWPAPPRSEPYRPRPVPARPPSEEAIDPAPADLPAGVISRKKWSKSPPNYTGMDRMTEITHITIHHDALSPFLATDAAASEARLELIRSAHRNKQWADIGYHYIVDRAGRIYEGRPITWQGAHVKDRNPGNIGILCMGNFEIQSPSERQMQALAMHVRVLRSRHRIPTKNVVTHREWPGAKTLCPGINLQRQVAVMRSNRAWA